MRGHLFRSCAIPAQAWSRNHGLDIRDRIRSRDCMWADFRLLAFAPCEMSSVRRASSHVERRNWKLVGRNMQPLQNPVGSKNRRGLRQCCRRHPLEVRKRKASNIDRSDDAYQFAGAHAWEIKCQAQTTAAAALSSIVRPPKHTSFRCSRACLFMLGVATRPKGRQR